MPNLYHWRSLQEYVQASIAQAYGKLAKFIVY
jgi:hypothetical protein